MTDSEWDDFIKEVDDNDNGMVILRRVNKFQIEFDEFKKMMKNLTNKAIGGAKQSSGAEK